MNAAVRLVSIPLALLSLSLVSGMASAFQLGDVVFNNSANRFEFRIPVLELDRDASSKLTGTIYSQNDVVDSFSYNIENAGEALEFVANLDEAINESFVFVVEMSYRGQVTGRRYEYEYDGGTDNTAKQKAASFSITPGRVDRFVPSAKFNLDLKHTTHLVATGQTLWDIAVDCEAIGGNNFQRSLAIFAANPDKFVNGDINQLTVNTTLDIPKQSYVDLFSPSEAASVFYKLASGTLAMDATFDDASTTTIDTSIDLKETESSAIEISASREVPTEQAMLARRIDNLESRLRSVIDNQNSHVSKVLSELESRIERLETKQ